MKNLGLFFIIIFPVVLMGQSIQGGIKGGWNYTHIVGTPGQWNDVSFDKSSSFHFGGYINLSLSEKMSVQGEILYSGKGSIISISDTTGNTKTNLKLNYITFPLLLQYRSGLIGLHIGPEFGFQVYRGSSDEKYVLTEADFWDQQYDFSLVGGGSIHLGSISFTARYGRAMTDLFEVENTGPDGRSTGKGTYGNLSFWQLSIGLKLF